MGSLSIFKAKIKPRFRQCQKEANCDFHCENYYSWLDASQSFAHFGRDGLDCIITAPIGALMITLELKV